MDGNKSKALQAVSSISQERNIADEFGSGGRGGGLATQ